MNKLNTVFLMSLFVLLQMAVAADADDRYPPLVKEAFDNMARDDSVDWTCLVTTTETKKTRVERCDYRDGDCEWQLLTENGEPPSDKQLGKYREEKDELKANENKKENNRFERLATPGSVKLLQEDSTTARYAFAPRPESEDDKKVLEKMDGSLVVNKSGPFVASFEMTNTDTLKVAPLVKLHVMRVSMNFAPLQKGGPYFPELQHSVVEGKIGGLKKIRQNTRVAFSDCALLDDQD
ncbi:MAG: hypothetical protein KJO35_03745 [Gammaproteobacteria bacterium]|nr:hypothetical protein [Gammaproteobacteria bacterium]NNF67494.1 hypothetical protein [Gammaproteobacteria bacterium]